MSIARAIFDRRGPIAALLLGAALAVPGAALAARLRARLPDPWNANRHIVVLTDAPAPTAGTPLVRMEPRLEVIGVVEGESPLPAGHPVATDAAARVSLYPEGAGLLRDDSRLELRMASPDLLEIVTKHFTPERRALIAAHAKAWQAQHEAAIDASIARVQEITRRELGPDELGRRLYEDPALRDAISGAFEREVVDAIDWDEVVNRALASDAAASTVELLKHAGPISSGWAGLKAGYRARWARAFGEAREGVGAAADGGSRTLEAIAAGDPDEALLEGGATIGDVVGRVDVSRVATDPAGWILDRTLALIVPEGRSFKEGALDQAGANVRRHLPRHRDRLRRDYVRLGKDLTERTALADRSLSALKGLALDPSLRDDLVARHGPEAERRLARLAEALSTDEELERRSRAAITSGLELLAGVLRDLALDDEGKGPNPLLVAFVRARLLGREAPVLVLRSPGSGEPVSEGQAFPCRRR
jgi:hypothetical protein